MKKMKLELICSDSNFEKIEIENWEIDIPKEGQYFKAYNYIRKIEKIIWEYKQDLIVITITLSKNDKISIIDF